MTRSKMEQISNNFSRFIDRRTGIFFSLIDFFFFLVCLKSPLPTMFDAERARL